MGPGVTFPGATLPELTLSPLTMQWDGAVVRHHVVTVGDEASSAEATITVIPETEAPTILTSNGIAPTRRVTLSFQNPSPRPVRKMPETTVFPQEMFPSNLLPCYRTTAWFCWRRESSNWHQHSDRQ